MAQVTYITARGGLSLEGALQKYVSATDAMIACKMAELCPTLSFVYMRVQSSAKSVGRTMYAMKQEWPMSVGVYAVFPTGDDGECVLMIDKLCLRTVRRLFLVNSAHIMPLYQTLLYDATHIPVNKYIVMTRETTAESAPEIVRCPAVDMMSYCWSVHNMACNVAVITLAGYRNHTATVRVPLPHETGFGMMSRLAELIGIWGSVAEIHKEVALSHKNLVGTLYTCLGAFVCQHTSAVKKRPTHMISRVAYRCLQGMFSGEDDMTHSLAERHRELVRSLEAMSLAEPYWTHGTGKYTDTYVPILVDVGKAATDKEALTDGLTTVFYYYKFLLDTSVPISRETRLKILRGICLVRSAKTPTAPPTAETTDLPSIMKSVPSAAWMTYMQTNDAALWKTLSKDHPCYVDMAPNPALSSATRTYPLYAFLRMAMYANDVPGGVKQGRDLMGRFSADPATIVRREGVVPDFPVGMTTSAHFAFNRLTRAPPIARAKKGLIYNSDFLGVYSYSASRYRVLGTGEKVYPEWLIAELYAGHEGVYYEAARQVFMGAMKTSTRRVYEGADVPIAIDRKLLDRPTMLLMSHATPVAVHAPIPPSIEEEEAREAARKLPDAVVKHVALNWGDEDMMSPDDDALFEELIRKHQPNQYQKMRQILK